MRFVLYSFTYLFPQKTLKFHVFLPLIKIKTKLKIYDVYNM